MSTELAVFYRLSGKIHRTLACAQYAGLSQAFSHEAAAPEVSSCFRPLFFCFVGNYRGFILIIQDYLSSLAPPAKSLWQHAHIFMGEAMGQSSKDPKYSLPQWVRDTNFV